MLQVIIANYINTYTLNSAQMKTNSKCYMYKLLQKLCLICLQVPNCILPLFMWNTIQSTISKEMKKIRKKQP